MAKIQLLWPGKTKESWLKQGIEFYVKRLSNYYQVKLTETRAARFSQHEMEKAAQKESKDLIKALSGKRAFVVVLDVKGRKLSSQELAGLLKKKQNQGISAFDFVIGGAYGVTQDLLDKADLVLSLSKMTFTHEMSRVILLEQLYRAASINAGSRYHH